MSSIAHLCRKVLLLSLLAFSVKPHHAFVNHRYSYKTPAPKSMTEMNGAASSLAQYAPTAVSLFNNMKTPASILAGAMVPLGFLAALPATGREEKKFEKSMRKAHLALAVISLLNELMSVMWATVAVNQLTEISRAPTESVWHLLKRDFNLDWAAVNAHFILGMLGFMSMVGIRGYFAAVAGGFSTAGSAAVGSFAMSGMLLMIAIVNRGTAAGGGTTGARYGVTILSIITTYFKLLFKRATSLKTFGVLEVASIVCAGIASIVALNSAFRSEEKE